MRRSDKILISAIHIDFPDGNRRIRVSCKSEGKLERHLINNLSKIDLLCIIDNLCLIYNCSKTKIEVPEKIQIGISKIGE